jgi:hypothetical protein
MQEFREDKINYLPYVIGLTVVVIIIIVILQNKSSEPTTPLIRSFNISPTIKQTTIIPQTTTIQPTTTTIPQTTTIQPTTTTNPRITTIQPTTTTNPQTTSILSIRPISSTSDLPLYQFISHTFTTAGKNGPNGPTLAEIKSAYSGVIWAQNSEFLNMTTQGIQEWKVPITGNYRIRCIGAGVPYTSSNDPNGRSEFQKGMDATITTTLKKDEVIMILVGQQPKLSSSFELTGGAGGSFVVKNTLKSPIAIIVAGGGGGRGNGGATSTSNANVNTSGKQGDGTGEAYSPNNKQNGGGYKGENGYGGGGTGLAAGGGGILDNGINSDYKAAGGYSFRNGGMGGTTHNLIDYPNSEGGFGGGGAAAGGGGGGGGGYSGGGGGGFLNYWASGGGGGSFSLTGSFDSAIANNNNNGSVIITLL